MAFHGRDTHIFWDNTLQLVCLEDWKRNFCLVFIGCHCQPCFDDILVANAGGPNLWEPHSISSLNSIRVQHVASGPSACHSIIICEGGTLMSFGE